MIQKIIVENFMAHKRTELELGPGVTALTGPNNTGKSALVEALRCVTESPVPKHFIRHGEKEARVTVELDDGHSITWIRKKASPGYEIMRPGADEPETFWKLGRSGVPDEVRQLLRMDKVDLDDNNPIDVHIGDQREPVFLLNRPDRAVADFLASSSEGAHLLSMQGVLKRKVLDAKRELNGRKARLTHIEEELDSLAPLPDIELVMQSARELRDRLDTLEKEIPALETILAARDDVVKQKAQAETELVTLNTLRAVPSVEDPKPLAALLMEQVDLNHRLTFAGAYQQQLAELSPVPSTNPTELLVLLREQLKAVADELSENDRKADLLALLTVPPVMTDCVDLDRLHDEIINNLEEQKAVVGMKQQLDSLSNPPEITLPEGLVEVVVELQTAKRELMQAEAEAVQADEELTVFAGQLRERLAVIGQCPTCGGALLEGAFMQDRGTHE